MLPKYTRHYSASTTYDFSTCENGITLPLPVANEEEVQDWKRVLARWDKFIVKNKPKARVLVRRGIPGEIRGEVWKVTSGAHALKVKNPGVYEILVQENSQVETCLIKDVHRTFPTQKMFKLKEGSGQRALFNVLKVFSIMDPEVGYCQGMSFICGVLVTYLSEVDSFWVLASLLKSYNFRGLFLSDLPLLKHYLYRFYFLVYAYLPLLGKHFDDQGIRPLFYCAEWFSTLYSYNIDFELTCRIWDVLFLDGPEYLFRVGLAILKISEKDLLALKFDDIMIYLKNKTSELDFTIISEADKFTNLDRTLAEIDQQFELVREKIVAGCSEEALAPSIKRIVIQNSEEDNSGYSSDKELEEEEGELEMENKNDGNNKEREKENSVTSGCFNAITNSVPAL